MPKQKPLTSRVLQCLVLLSFSLTTWGFTGNKTRFVKQHGEFRVAEMVPFFSLKRSNGRALFSEEIKSGSKGYALVFFQTSCRPCVEGMERLSKAKNRLQSAGIHTVFVHVKEPKGSGRYWSDQEIISWLGHKKLVYDEVLFDRTGSLEAAGLYVDKGGMKTIQLPLTVLVANNQKVRAIARVEGKDLVDAVINKLTP